MKNQRSIPFLVISILLLVVGGVTLVPTLLSISYMQLAAAILGKSVYFTLVLAFATAALLIVVGILGIARYKKPAKLEGNIFLGLLLMALQAASFLISRSADVEMSTSTLISSLAGLGLTAAYILLALHFRKKSIRQSHRREEA